MSAAASPPTGEAASPPLPSPTEAFRLGGDPPRVTRLSRKALATVGVIAGLSIGGALIYALKPPAKTAATEVYATGGSAKVEKLATGPKDYSQIPQLGPPLPGDLGKPILAAQRDGDAGATAGDGVSSAPTANDPAALARQKARQDRETARESQLFSTRSGQSGGGGNRSEPTDPALVAGDAPAGTATTAQPQDIAPSTGQAAKRAFLSRADRQPSLSPAALEAPASVNVVQAGSIIPAALITGIRSDLPGQITAQVTQNIYDSPTGRHLLIPQGARLIGEYDSQIEAGQTRLLMAWTRLILPDGRSILLDRLPGSDRSGVAGLQDRINSHWGGVARAALISTVLGLGSELATGDDGDIVRALRRGSQDTVNQAAQQIVQRQLAIQPTLTIRPGHPVRVMVTRDLVIEPWGGH